MLWMLQSGVIPLLAATPARSQATPLLARGRAALRVPDNRNRLLIVAGWAAVIALIPPWHEYPVIDDSLYATSVRDMLATGRFVMPDFSQANLIAQTVWGTLWARLFGFGFSTLTASTLVLALAALFAFYGLARAVGVAPGGALLGTALLGFNPIFIHLSYTFMTDIPFLALTLGACYGYVRGLGAEGRARLGWLALAGTLAGGSFLVRQFGALTPLPFVGLVLWESVRTRRLAWRELLTLVAVPALFGLAWYVWWRADPPTGAAMAAGARSAYFIGKEPWLRVFLLRAFTILPLTALCAWAALRLPRARWGLVAVIGAALLWGMWAADLPSEQWIAVFEPPFTARLGPLSYDLPQEPFSFAAEGNIVKLDGIDFDEFGYAQERIWTMEAWRAIYMGGVALVMLLGAALISALWDWGRGIRQTWTLTPLAAVYALGAAVFVVSLAFPGDLFDRYTLAFVPFLLLFLMRGAAGWGRGAWGYSLLALALLATFSLLAKADHMDQNNARWAAGRWMEARVGAVQVGWNWNQWGHASSEGYHVTGIHQEGWRVEQEFPYTSRLSGWTTRIVWAESRPDMPPLPSPITLAPAP